MSRPRNWKKASSLPSQALMTHHCDRDAPPLYLAISIHHLAVNSPIKHQLSALNCVQAHLTIKYPLAHLSKRLRGGETIVGKASSWEGKWGLSMTSEWNVLTFIVLQDFCFVKWEHLEPFFLQDAYFEISWMINIIQLLWNLHFPTSQVGTRDKHAGASPKQPADSDRKLNSALFM